MRKSLAKYLVIFEKIYPSHPSRDVYEVYERVLAGVPDLDLEAACEICLGECRYFPMPVDIKMRVKAPDTFVSTINDSDCTFCGGTGWKKVTGPDGAEFAVLCNCLKKKAQGGAK